MVERLRLNDEEFNAFIGARHCEASVSLVECGSRLTLSASVPQQGVSHPSNTPSHFPGAFTVISPPCVIRGIIRYYYGRVTGHNFLILMSAASFLDIRDRAVSLGKRGLACFEAMWVRLCTSGERGYDWTSKQLVQWLAHESRLPGAYSPLSFDHLQTEVQMGDVLLVEGRTRVSRAVRAITHSVWTHSALVIGTLGQLRDPALRSIARRHLAEDELGAPLVVESELGRGTIVSSILRYRDDHLRLCRPIGLTESDARRVATFAMLHVGAGYDLRHILDLARFLVPWWWIIPRRWHSSLFEHHHQDPTRQICSTMIARAFSRVRFPVCALIVERQGKLSLLRRNSRLITPSEFDQSPYFAVIKYPLMGDDDLGFYHKLPWSDEGPMVDQLEEYLEDLRVRGVRLEDIVQGGTG